MPEQLWAHLDCGTITLSTHDHQGWEYLVVECPTHGHLFSIKGMPQGVRLKYGNPYHAQGRAQRERG